MSFRVVAANHDASIALIERTYSRHISDVSDTLVRRTLVDMAAGPVNNGNVVSTATTER
jgi:hypothetical protein